MARKYKLKHDCGKIDTRYTELVQITPSLHGIETDMTFV